MLQVQPTHLAKVHMSPPPPASDGAMVIRFDGRLREGSDPEIFAVIPLEGLARLPNRLLARLETLMIDAGTDAARPVFRETHGGAALYLPLEHADNEAFLSDVRGTLPTVSHMPDLRVLFGADGMGAFSRHAAFECSGNEFPEIDADQAFNRLITCRRPYLVQDFPEDPFESSGPAADRDTDPSM